MTPWLVLALALFVHVPAGAQAPSDEAARARVDEVVRTTMADRHFPSAVVAVVRDGVIVNVGAYGQMRLREADELARLIAPLYDPDLVWTVRRPPLLNEGLEPSTEERKDAP